MSDPKNSPISLPSLHSAAKRKILAYTLKYSHPAAEYFRLLPTEIEGIARCTPLQEGMIYRFLESEKPLYCTSFSFELGHSVDLGHLKKAWANVQRIVQLLRVRFLPTPEGYVQVVLKEDDLPWSEINAVSEDSVAHLKDQTFQIWQEEVNNFMCAPWKVHIIKSRCKVFMCLYIFHALYDGHSLPLLLEKVALNYLGRDPLFNTPSFLEVLPMGPLRKIPGTREFWVNHLANSRGHQIATASETMSSIPVVSTLRINKIEGLEELKRSLKVTEHSILHACWLIVLHHYFASVPIVGIVVSGRSLDVPGVEDIIGPLFNTIPSNVQFSQLRTWSELVQACHHYYASVLPFQHTALRDLMKWTKRTPYMPLFEVLFVFNKENNNTSKATDELWMHLDSKSELEYPLALEAVRGNDGSLALTVTAKSEYVSADRAREVAGTFQETLLQLVQDPLRVLPSRNASVETTISSSNTDTHDEQNYKDISERKNFMFKWTPETYRIREVIANLAGVEPEVVGEEISIFELGLDSIDAIKLTSTLAKVGIGLPVSTIVRYRTIQQMAEKMVIITEPTIDDSVSSLVQYERDLKEILRKEGKLPEDVSRIFPTTPLQEAMVAEMLASDYRRYYNHDILEVGPQIDLERLLRAWRDVINAHPILRTSFVEVQDPNIPFSYVQIIHSRGRTNFPIINLKGKPVHSLIDHELQREGDVDRPAFAIFVVINDGKSYICLSISHALYDGWSLELLHGDVARCYAGENCERPSYETVLGKIISASGDKNLDFWQTMLANYHPAHFPQRSQVGENQFTFHRGEKLLSMTSGEAHAFCMYHNVTVQALAATCWTLVLAGYLEKLDIVFGLVLSGRNFDNAAEVMFPTMNTVAMRSIIHGSRLDMLQQVQGTLSDIVEYQHFPLRKAGFKGGSGSLFDTLFIYQKRPTAMPSKQETLYRSIDSVSEVEYPISVEMEVVDSSLVWRVACRDSVLSYSDTTRLLDHIDRVFTLIVRDPDHATIDYLDGGISICESHAFQERGETTESSKSGAFTFQHQEQWSVVETKIRNVLSIVSMTPKERIGKEATLFHLGLDSISAIKVSSILKKQTIGLPVSEMIKAGSILNMAKIAESGYTPPLSLDVKEELTKMMDNVDLKYLLQSYDIDSQIVETAFPTTPGQTYLLAMNQINPDAFYPNFIYIARGPLSKQQLNNAWVQLTKQIPLLRTTFIATGQKDCLFIQVVMKHAHNPVGWHMSTDNKFFHGETKRGIGITPVSLRACQSVNRTVVILQIHHALYDAVSLPKLVDTLARFCSDPTYKIDNKVDLSEFVAFQNVHSPLTVRRHFWEQYLKHVVKSRNPNTEKASPSAIGRYYRPGLYKEISRIEDFAKVHGLSVQALFLAVYARIHIHLNRCDIDDEMQPRYIAIGVYLANRGYDLEGLPSLLAPTLNIVPLVIEIASDNESVLRVAHNVQRDLHQISKVEHSSVSIVEIADWTGIRLDVCVNLLRLLEADNPVQDLPEGQVRFDLLAEEGLISRDLKSSEMANTNERLNVGSTVDCQFNQQDMEKTLGVQDEFKFPGDVYKVEYNPVNELYIEC